MLTTLRVHGKVGVDQVSQFNHICQVIAEQGYEVRIVFNTSWNSRGVENIQADLVDAGFTHPSMLWGTTATNEGGGYLVRRWFDEHPEFIGCPYLILDDGTRGYDELWCRLIYTNYKAGLTGREAEISVQIVKRGIDQTQERLQAIQNIHHWCEKFYERTRVSNEWTDEKAARVLRERYDLIGRVAFDPDFMKKARLEA